MQSAATALAEIDGVLQQLAASNAQIVAELATTPPFWETLLQFGKAFETFRYHQSLAWRVPLWVYSPRVSQAQVGETPRRAKAQNPIFERSASLYAAEPTACKFCATTAYDRQLAVQASLATNSNFITDCESEAVRKIDQINRAESLQAAVLLLNRVNLGYSPTPAASAAELKKGKAKPAARKIAHSPPLDDALHAENSGAENSGADHSSADHSGADNSGASNSGSESEARARPAALGQNAKS